MTMIRGSKHGRALCRIRGAAALGLAWIVLASAGPAQACRFNVRDVGFVELGRSAYQLYWFVDAGVPAETVSALKAVSQAALLDVNIRAEVLSVQEVPGQAAEDSFRRHAASHTPPWAALVAPDGRSLPMDWEKPPGETNLEAALWSFLERLYLSPQREALQEKIIRSYGVVLVVEGKDAAENGRARQAAQQVVQDLTRSMESLPKEIESPPVMMVVDQAAAAREQVFLWSLGLAENPPAEAHAAVLYGRGRLIGSVLKGPEITATRLLNIMGTIGLSCECGLDRSWMQGTMVPLSWDDRVLARLAELLGFDTESPMIKTEMSQILSKGQNSRAPGNGRSPAPAEGADLFLGYTEEALVLADPGEAAGETAVPPAEIPEGSAANPDGSKPPGLGGGDPGEEAASGSSKAMPRRWTRTWGILGIMGLAVLLSGISLLWIRRV